MSFYTKQNERRTCEKKSHLGKDSFPSRTQPLQRKKLHDSKTCEIVQVGETFTPFELT